MRVVKTAIPLRVCGLGWDECGQVRTAAMTTEHGYRIPSGVFYMYTREEWLNTVLSGTLKPKPPDWWLRAQETNEGRDRRTASIIWSRHYDAARKYAIWALAPEEDFRALGYLL